MNKKNFFGVAYVSIAVIVWGTIGSLIDLPLLNTDVYSAGSVGQYITFSFTGLATTVLGIVLFPKITQSPFIIGLLED